MMFLTRKRNKNLSVRLSETEAAFVERRRAAANLALREFLLMCIRDTTIEVKPHGTEIVIELKRIGNNLNQITRRINEGRAYDCTKQLELIRSELEELRTEWL